MSAASAIATAGLGQNSSVEQFLLLGLGAGGEADPTPATREVSIETEFYIITVAEISETQNITDIMVWDSDGWNTGKVWG